MLKQLLENFCTNIPQLKKIITTEEATKHSFIMPFLQMLGYNIFNPQEVVPEFTADIGIKKGEKVDYAILKDNKPIILIEVKKCCEKLENHSSQLVRYFNATEVKFAILTNGLEYKFYSDLDKDNIMDTKPFLSINLEKLADKDILEIEKFSKSLIDINNIIDLANSKKYIGDINELIANEFKNPSDEFIKFFISKVIDGRVTKNKIDEFKAYFDIAIKDFINSELTKKIEQVSNQVVEKKIEKVENIKNENEMESIYIVKAILANDIELNRVSYKQNKSCLTVFLDKDVKKWLCKIYFNSNQIHLAFQKNNNEDERVTIDKIEDIYKYKGKLKTALFNMNN